MFFGKHFASMYEGSLIGKGPVVFAVMGYVIANQRPDAVCGSQVRLNSLLLATIIGTSQQEIEKAISFLCAPDPQSTSPDKEGRRIVKVGQFDYQVVNGPKYLAIRNEEQRREQNRDAQTRHRAKKGKLFVGAPKTLAEKVDEKKGGECLSNRL